jgi:hypothetical protein
MFWIMTIVVLVAFIVVTEIAVAREDKEWQREREIRHYKDKIIESRKRNKKDNGIF